MTKLYPILFVESLLSPEAELYIDLKQYVEDTLLPMALQSGFRFPTPEEVKKQRLDTDYYKETPEIRKTWLLVHDTEPDVKLSLTITKELVYASQKQTFLLYGYLTGMQGEGNTLHIKFTLTNSVYETAEQERITEKFVRILQGVPVAAENIREFMKRRPDLYQQDDVGTEQQRSQQEGEYD